MYLSFVIVLRQSFNISFVSLFLNILVVDIWMGSFSIRFPKVLIDTKAITFCVQNLEFLFSKVLNPICFS